MADEPASPERLDEVAALIDRWLEGELTRNPVVAAVDRHEDPITGERLWRVRVTGEQKDVFAIWYRLRQRTLQFETYVMPAPEENHARFYEHLLRRNRRLNGLAFCIGEEDAVFLVGSLPVHALDEGELDRTLGSIYACVEQCFRPALRIGFGSRLGL
jgi:hypothetical protein